MIFDDEQDAQQDALIRELATAVLRELLTDNTYYNQYLRDEYETDSPVDNTLTYQGGWWTALYSFCEEDGREIGRIERTVPKRWHATHEAAERWIASLEHRVAKDGHYSEEFRISTTEPVEYY